MEKRYTLLRIIGTIYRILGIIGIVITILGSIGMCVVGFLGSTFISEYAAWIDLGFGPGEYVQVAISLIMAVGIFINGTAVSLASYAFGEGIHLLISLEKSARLTTRLIQT
ncbi:MAG TPA: hypothetical protein G4O08_06340 [Anaerolineae bacterium]|nr:hypothetical protein [Anaerolineae bacterium]